MKPSIVKLVRQGAGLYLCVPASICRALLLKAGDRLVVDYDADQLYMRRIPLEDLMPVRRAATGHVDGVGERYGEPVTVE